MAKIDRTELFERMPIRRAVALQILPAIAGQMITLIYNLADAYFVGMLNDPLQTAGITVAGMCFIALTTLSNLFGVGGASVIARALGKKDPQSAKQIAATAFWGGLAVSVLFSLLFFLFARPILFLCGATEETYAVTYNYAKWTVMVGGSATVLNALLANLVRSEGCAVHASIGVALGGVLNILIDPFFVLPQYLDMGAAGAGLATAISNGSAVVYFLCLLAFRRNNTVISVSPRHLRHLGRHLGKVLAGGFPSAVQHALVIVAAATLTSFISHDSTEAVAALGIVKKLDQLPLYFSLGTANGLLPLLAYSYSSGNQQRRAQAFRFGCTIAVGFSLLCLILYEIFADPLSRIFIDDAATIAYSRSFLRIMVVAMPMMSFCYCMIIQFQAMGKVRESLICSILRKGVLDIPLLFLMDYLFPLYGCLFVQPFVDAISLVIAAILYRRVQRQLIARPVKAEPLI